jgi:putative colanic acid biosynthesis acetyltransferase WcaF
MDLEHYTTGGFDRGRGRLVEALWLLVQALFVRSWIPGRSHRVWLLRRFGARIGRGVDIKPGVRVKFPWRLVVGEHSWIGEDVWIDNLAQVEIGSHCCVSQGVYLCTGSHDWSRSSFDLRIAPIALGDRCWVAAHALLGPGVAVGEGAVIALGSVVVRDAAAWMVHQGNPARPLKARPRG